MPHWVSDHQGIEKSPPSGWEAVRHEKDGRRAWVVPLGESVNHEGPTAPSVIDAVRRLSEKQDAGSRAWLPILDLIEEVGEPPSAVVEPQKHSLDSLISAYRQVTSLEASTLALGIVDALIELGNLSPGTAHGDLRTDRIYLAPGKDGKPDFSLPRLGPPVGRVNRLGRARSDAQALGQILAALLTQDRKTSHLDKDNLKLKHQVPTALRERWVTLVNDLLDGDYDRDGWDRLRNDLSSLQPAGRGSLKLIAYAVIAFLVLGGITASLLRPPPERKPPTVSLQGIKPGETYQVPKTINLIAEVNSNGHTISRVQFWGRDNLLWETSSPPYEYRHDVTTTGTLSISAVAFYDSGKASVKSKPATATFTAPRPLKPVPPQETFIAETLWQTVTNIVAANPNAFDTNHEWWTSRNVQVRPKQSETNRLIEFINSTNWIILKSNNNDFDTRLLDYLTEYNRANAIANLSNEFEKTLEQLATSRAQTKTNLLQFIASRDQCLSNAASAITNLDNALKSSLVIALTNRLELFQEEAIKYSMRPAYTNCCDVNFADITESLGLMPNHLTNTYFTTLVNQMSNIGAAWAASVSNFNRSVSTEYQTNSQLIKSITEKLYSVESEQQFLTSFFGLTNQEAIKNRLFELAGGSNQISELQKDAMTVGKSRTKVFMNSAIQGALNDISKNTPNWQQATNAVGKSWLLYVSNTLEPLWNALTLQSRTNDWSRAYNIITLLNKNGISNQHGTLVKVNPPNAEAWINNIVWFVKFSNFSQRLEGQDELKTATVDIPAGLTNGYFYYTNWPTLKGDVDRLKTAVKEENVNINSLIDQYNLTVTKHNNTGTSIPAAKSSHEWTNRQQELESLNRLIYQRKQAISKDKEKIAISALGGRRLSADEVDQALFDRYPVKRNKGRVEPDTKRDMWRVTLAAPERGPEIKKLINELQTVSGSVDADQRPKWDELVRLAEVIEKLCLYQKNSPN